jgi:hypothetical protein
MPLCSGLLVLNTLALASASDTLALALMCRLSCLGRSFHSVSCLHLTPTLAILLALARPSSASTISPDSPHRHDHVNQVAIDSPKPKLERVPSQVQERYSEISDLQAIYADTSLELRRWFRIGGEECLVLIKLWTVSTYNDFLSLHNMTRIWPHTILAPSTSTRPHLRRLANPRLRFINSAPPTFTAHRRQNARRCAVWCQVRDVPSRPKRRKTARASPLGTRYDDAIPLPLH